MFITFNKANKLLKNIEKYLKDNVYSSDSINIPNTFIIKQNNIITNENKDKFTEDLVSKQKMYINQYNDYFNMIEDYYKLKQILFKENLDNNISTILYKLNILQRKKIYLERKDNINKHNYNNYLLDSNIVDNINDDINNEEYKSNRNILIFDDQFIEKELKEVKKEINRLEDEKELVNSKKKINVNFSEFTNYTLGLTE